MKRFRILALALLTLFTLTANAQDIARPDGWVEESHSNDTAPDYAVVFPQTEVNTITITISPDAWQAIFDDMTGLYGQFGANPTMNRAMPQGFERPEGLDMPAFPPDGADMPDGFRMEGGMLGTEQNPIWVAVDVAFDDQTWTNVGFRLKGNSSLMSSWGGGNYKLPFKLEFDQFEDEYPEIDNQRFYGFKEVSFSSNWSDDSLLREKVTADIFREAGVPAAQTAFYAVYVDYGSGAEYFGLYTAVEVIDDTLIQTQFSDDSGNVYKPEGDGATFAAGSFTESAFDKQTNAKADDYSDIIGLFEALHADTRVTDPEAWRAGLESVFDVDGFIRWLATNQVVQNWDTYGQMSHNYYLYNNPSTGLLTWIPWDNNMALAEGMRGGGGRPGGNGGQNGGAGQGQGGGGLPGRFGAGLTIDLNSVTNDWPLIRFIMDDPVYHAQYVSDVDEVSTAVFNPEKMTAIYQSLHDLIAPYVTGENGEIRNHTFLDSPEDFETALTTLIEHVNTRYAAAQAYVAGE